MELRTALERIKSDVIDMHSRDAALFILNVFLVSDRSLILTFIPYSQ